MTTQVFYLAKVYYEADGYMALALLPKAYASYEEANDAIARQGPGLYQVQKFTEVK